MIHLTYFYLSHTHFCTAHHICLVLIVPIIIYEEYSLQIIKFFVMLLSLVFRYFLLGPNIFLTTLFRGSEHQEYGILGCDTVQFGI
jgi:hypothetical protein